MLTSHTLTDELSLRDLEPVCAGMDKGSAFGNTAVNMSASQILNRVGNGRAQGGASAQKRTGAITDRAR